MFGCVNKALFGAGKVAPQQKYEAGTLFGEGVNDGVCKGLPADLAMGGRLAGAHGEYGVEQKDALIRPMFQAGVGGNGDAQVALQLFEYI